MRWTVALPLIAFGAISCTMTPEPYSDVSDVKETPVDHFVHLQGQPGDATQKDRDFVYWATVQCLYQIELAQRAKTQATSSAVREFAQRVAEECQTQNGQLALVNEGHIGIVTLPSRLDRSHAAMVAQLEAQTGPAFDRVYVEDQIASSAEAVQLFRDQGNAGSDPVLQRFAATSVPDLQQRQSDAERLRAQFAD